MGKEVEMMTKGKETANKRKDTIPLFLMTLPGILKVFLFSYVPMAGIIIAFQEYNPTDMFFSPFNGFANFAYLFRSIDFARILTNTVLMNVLFITVGTVVALALALLLFEIARTRISKVAQISFFIPYFVSYVVVSVIVGAFLDGTGIVTSLIYRISGERIRFYMEPKYWRWILLIVHIWKSAGVTGIIYYTCLLNVDTSLYEAASIDGAGKFRQIFVVSLPQLKSMIIVLTLMNFANILRSDFNLFFFVTQNSSALYETTDVIDTYIYRAIKQTPNFGLASAVSLVQAVVGLALTLILNAAAKRIDENVSLF